AVFLLAAFLVVPAVGADRAFDVDQLSLLQVLAADLTELSPGRDVVPLRPFLFLTVLVGEALIGGDGELRHARAARGGADLRIFAEAADEDDFVDHVNLLL